MQYQENLFFVAKTIFRCASTLKIPIFFYPNPTLFNLNEFNTTKMEENAIAPDAMMGESNMPVNGYSAPAATGIPMML